MRSLLSLLDGAVRRSASAVTLESGQPVVYTTARGAEAESTVLPPTELFEMIVAAVDDAHQVELAVGNPVEFSIDAGASWTVYAEPGMEGITVRAHRGGVDASPARGGLEIELDDDGEVASAAALPLGLDDPDDADDVPTGNRRRDLSEEALDTPAVDEPGSVDYSISGPLPAEAAFESGTWALAEDDEFGGPALGTDEYGSLGTLGEGVDSRPVRPSPMPEAEEFGARGFAIVPPADGHIGVPADDDDEAAQFDPFPESSPASDVDRRNRLSPTVKAMSASPAPAAPAMNQAEVARDRAEMSAAGGMSVSGTAGTVTRLDHGNAATAAAAARASTRREMTAIRSPEADTLRELPSFGHGEAELNEIVADIGEGTLVYVREPGFIDTLAQAFLSPSITIDDQADPAEVWTRVRGMPAGAILIVRCENPSRLLGWILRRLEEGYRVLVETRARTPEGARRVLLGVSATDRAEQWLDSQLTLTIEPGEQGPKLLAL
ncbi:hypothetical protein DB30_04480 [Enhygromyxa salina]|uniref:Uncharacterized protein n=1 Tax=Enhygromyxa salina TaxID=215803 RepID=A0A0C2CZM7_9BACT|nr:hypothetical protein [Enhygromyxa salina]KIG16436.1 hypothetical protein DB30_04480 [Enhygromyxa salina]